MKKKIPTSQIPYSKAIFLDRDGTLFEDGKYLFEYEKIKWFPESFSALKLWQINGFKLVIITNQSGIARGFFTLEQLDFFHQKMGEKLRQEGIHILGIYFCPHHPEGIHPDFTLECPCRKPKPGLFLKAQKEHQLNLSLSFSFGDKLRDAQAGAHAGVTSFLIGDRSESPFPVFKSLLDGAHFTCEWSRKWEVKPDGV